MPPPRPQVKDDIRIEVFIHKVRLRHPELQFSTQPHTKTPMADMLIRGPRRGRAVANPGGAHCLRGDLPIQMGCNTIWSRPHRFHV